ncbi:MAG: RHS repeat-associated core domain-containing protein [Pyrinomonadaceae bacterium]
MMMLPNVDQEYTFTYDPQGRVLTQTRNSQTMTFTYDAVGNRATRTDYLGHVTSYTYDDLNRLTNVGYTGASGENASYTYDDLSRLLTAVNAAGTVTFTYDNRGRLATEEDVFGHDLEYTYDAAGRKTLLKLDTANHTAYAYDNANRLTTLTDEASNDFTFAYDNANRLTSRVMPNCVTSTYTYDNMSRLKRLKHENTSTTLYDDQFTYNTANQISQIAGLAATKNYTYDNINRLTAVTVGGSTVESYTYDAVGNRTASHLSSSYTIGAFNRVTATDSATYTYNANGSTTGKTVGAVNWTYGWDRENRMVSAGDGTNSAAYVYDALGRRVKRTQGSSVEKYTNDGQDVVLDDVNSTLTKYQNGPGIDNKFKSISGGTSKYFLSDHLGSTAVLASSSGTSVDSNSYDSYGNASNGSFVSRYQFTGRELDPLTGINYYRARFYDDDLGRFVSEDPIGFKGDDINLYGYVWNDPIRFRDPRGTQGAIAVPAAGAVAWGGPAGWLVGGGIIAIYGAWRIGNATADHPWNPFVAGPLNPYRNWDRFWNPTITTACPTSSATPMAQTTPRPYPRPNEPRRSCRNTDSTINPVNGMKYCYYQCRGGGFPGLYTIVTIVGANTPCPSPDGNDNDWVPGGV